MEEDCRERERERGRRRERERKRKSGWMGVRRSWGGGEGGEGREGRKGGMGKGQPGTLYQFVCAPFEGRERRVRCKCYN